MVVQKLQDVALGTKLGNRLEKLFSQILCRELAILQLTINLDTLYFVGNNLQYFYS